MGRDEGSTECLEEGTDEGIEDGFLVWFLKAVITELLTNVGLLDDSKESSRDGKNIEISVGSDEGTNEGLFVGSEEGVSDGVIVGCFEGNGVGVGIVDALDIEKYAV